MLHKADNIFCRTCTIWLAAIFSAKVRLDPHFVKRESCASSCDRVLTLMMTSQQLEVYNIPFSRLKRKVCADQLEDLKNRWEPITFRL